MAGSSIQRFQLASTSVNITLSIAANQRCLITATENLRVAYDEAELANSRNYFFLQFKAASSIAQTDPFIIEPNGAMDGQRTLFVRVDTVPCAVHVWLQGGEV